MLEGLLRHDTSADIDRNYTDTHGASIVGFAFCHLLPLARALQARGHHVRWATGRESCARLEHVGFDAASAGAQTPFAGSSEAPWRDAPAVRERLANSLGERRSDGSRGVVPSACRRDGLRLCVRRSVVPA